MTTTLIPERLQAVADVPLTVGGHEPPPDGAPPCGFCVMEKYAYVTGHEWTDHPSNCSRVIAAFLRRYNDSTDQAGRNQVDSWVFANVDRLVATAKDGKDRARGYLMADWAIRTSLPLWLELAGANEAAATLRALPRIVDVESARAGRGAARDARVGLPDYWAWRAELREKVREAVKEALKDKPAAAATVATTVAAATVAADAATVATTVAAATVAADAAADAADAAAATTATTAATVATVADAAAATVATAADAAAATVAAAATAATATADPYAPNGLYDQVYRAVRERLLETFNERWEPAITPIKASVLELLEALIDPEQAA